MKVFLDWREISNEGDCYKALLSQLKAPEWHGHNLDALAGSLITGEINGIEPPFCIINLNVDSLSNELTLLYQKVAAIYKEAKQSGRVIRVFEE